MNLGWVHILFKAKIDGNENMLEDFKFRYH